MLCPLLGDQGRQGLSLQAQGCPRALWGPDASVTLTGGPTLAWPSSLWSDKQCRPSHVITPLRCGIKPPTPLNLGWSRDLCGQQSVVEVRL